MTASTTEVQPGPRRPPTTLGTLPRPLRATGRATGRALRRVTVPAWVLAGLMAVWSFEFIRLGWLRHSRFGTFSFDLGIYDQGTWLLSRGKDPFVTVRGLELFGHHVNGIFLLFAPFYRLGAGPGFLLVVQVLVQASGAAAVYLLARDRLGDRWLAAALGAVLLLNPTYQWLTWEFFHPDAIAIAPLLFAYWAARAGRWGWFTLFAVLAAACKEDVALALVVIGILAVFWGHRRRGLVIAGLSIAWYFVATRLVIPWQNGIGPFYDTFFGNLGHNPAEVAGHMVTHPREAFDLATESDRVTWYWRMFAPFAFVPLLALPVLAVGGPMFAVNVLSSFPYTRDFRYHYSSLVLAGLVLATVEGIAWAGRTPTVRRVLVGAVLVSSLVATVNWGPSRIGDQYATGTWPLQSDRQVAKEAAVALVPDGAPTSAVYNFVPHLAHRELIYDFPNPWRVVNWGVRGEHPPDPAAVRWIVVDRREMSPEDAALFARLARRQCVVVFERDDIVVAKRIHAPPSRSRP